MAVVHSIRQFHSEVAIVCSALEGMFHWLENESEKVGAVQYPIIARLRELLDEADSLVGPDEV